MAKQSDYTITTFERKPGLWRASVMAVGSVGDRKMRSVITEEDSVSEKDAEFAAMKMIQTMGE